LTSAINQGGNEHHTKARALNQTKRIKETNEKGSPGEFLEARQWLRSIEQRLRQKMTVSRAPLSLMLPDYSDPLSLLYSILTSLALTNYHQISHAFASEIDCVI